MPFPSEFPWYYLLTNQDVIQAIESETLLLRLLWWFDFMHLSEIGIWNWEAISSWHCSWMNWFAFSLCASRSQTLGTVVFPWRVPMWHSSQNWNFKSMKEHELNVKTKRERCFVAHPGWTICRAIRSDKLRQWFALLPRWIEGKKGWIRPVIIQ